MSGLFYRMRVALGVAAVVHMLLSIFGMPESHQAKLPMLAIAWILGFSWVSAGHREGLDD